MSLTLDDAAITVIAATDVATDPPDEPTDPLNLHRFPTVRTLFDYEGTVDACVVRAWLRDEASGAWYAGPSTDDLDALAPGGASPVDEARDWAFGRGSEVAFQVVSISGGGTVAVRAQGVAL